jgi:predicted phosphoribosyltransferase
MIRLPFADREEAARELAAALAGYRGQRPLVLAVPRGAVPMGKIIAQALDGELDVALVRKLGAPGNPEFAIGSVDETGHVYVADHARMLGIGDRYIQQETAAQLEVMRQRRAQYTPVHPPIDPRDRVVIVVDDGIATGSTLIAALRAARAKQPKRLIAAVAVAPAETLDKLRHETETATGPALARGPRLHPLADEVVCLATPEPFHAVGQFFRDFRQVTDEEVIELLAADRSSPS